METRKMTERDSDIWEGGSLMSQLPLEFDSGYVLESLHVGCPRCSVDTPDENVRGFVSQPFPHMATVDCIGWCSECGLFFPVVYRVSNKLVVSSPESNWEPVVIPHYTSPWLVRKSREFFRWLASLARGNCRHG